MIAVQSGILEETVQRVVRQIRFRASGVCRPDVRPPLVEQVRPNSSLRGACGLTVLCPTVPWPPS